jgi:hypothetical protein
MTFFTDIFGDRTDVKSSSSLLSSEIDIKQFNDLLEVLAGISVSFSIFNQKNLKFEPSFSAPTSLVSMEAARILPQSQEEEDEQFRLAIELSLKEEKKQPIKTPPITPPKQKAEVEYAYHFNYLEGKQYKEANPGAIKIEDIFIVPKF